MFTTAIAAVVLAGSIAMPPIVGNSWSLNNWAPLKAEYQNCAEKAQSTFSYYVCTSSAYQTAVTDTRKA